MKHTCLSCVPLGKTSRDEWVRKTATHISMMFKLKYLNGQEEHQADLGTVSTQDLLNEAKAESYDQLAYLHELERRLMTAEGFVVIDRMTLARLIEGAEDYGMEFPVSLLKQFDMKESIASAKALLEQKV